MPHLRTQLRTAAAALLTGLPTTGSRVHVNRMRPIAAADCPALVVYLGGEEDITARDYGRTLELARPFALHVRGKAAGDDAEATLDQMAAEVEAALMATPAAYTLGGLVKPKLWLSALSDPEIEDDTAPRLAAQTLTFRGEYRTQAHDPTTSTI